MGTVAITILNYNTYEYTIECIKSIFEQSYSYYTICIVDNASTNDSVEKISEFLINSNKSFIIVDEDEYQECNFEKDVVFIKSSINNGYAAGNNKALKMAVKSRKFDYYWIINNDTIVEKDTLILMIEEIEGDELKRPVGNYVYYYDYKNKLQMAGGLEISSKNFKPYFSNNKQKIDYLGGVSYLIDNCFIDKYGLMYEEYFLNSEDLEYFYEYKINFINQNKNELPFNVVGKIYHKESATQGKVSPMSNYYYSRNLLYSCKKFNSRILGNLYIFFLMRIIKWGILDKRMAKSIIYAIRDYRKGIKGKVDYFN